MLFVLGLVHALCSYVLHRELFIIGINSSRLDPLSSIQINVYDECKVDISDTSDEERKTVHYRFYNKWIGTTQVPLHDVLSLGSVSKERQVSTEYSFFFLIHDHIKKVLWSLSATSHEFVLGKDEIDDLKR